ncbi:MAG: hypothetical protein LBK76_07600 [Verrucomicrobiales bacterium]|jgi:hypothetical protein|nr:hypothetical protein [Verrucomicrobiales bacterium]
MKPKTPPKKELSFAVAVGRALRRAAKRARADARRYGTKIHVIENGKIVALEP